MNKSGYEKLGRKIYKSFKFLKTFLITLFWFIYGYYCLWFIFALVDRWMNDTIQYTILYHLGIITLIPVLAITIYETS